MKVEGYCLIHNKEIHGVQMVTKAIHKAWKNGELWQEIQFIPIRHMGFYIEPSTCWVLKEE